MGMGMIGRAIAAGIGGGAEATGQMMGRQALMDMEEQKMMRIEKWKAEFQDTRAANKAVSIENRAKGYAGERVATESGALDNTGAAYDQLLAEGKMTQEQYDVAKGALDSGKGLINKELGTVTAEDRMMGQATEDSDFKAIAMLKATQAEREAAREDRGAARDETARYHDAMIRQGDERLAVRKEKGEGSPKSTAKQAAIDKAVTRYNRAAKFLAAGDDPGGSAKAMLTAAEAELRALGVKVGNTGEGKQRFKVVDTDEGKRKMDTWTGETSSLDDVSTKGGGAGWGITRKN
jgi:hypothetical protein